MSAPVQPVVMTHLWDVSHPYYCNEGNYFTTASECSTHYSRWQDFVAEQGDNDLDMNLVFRFDWEPPWKDGDPDNAIEWQGDEYYRDSRLKLFYMGQRKGFYRWVTVDVCRADEPAVREWLQVRWDHMRTLWEPLSS
jgi:hypothetical protein